MYQEGCEFSKDDPTLAICRSNYVGPNGKVPGAEIRYRFLDEEGSQAVVEGFNAMGADIDEADRLQKRLNNVMHQYGVTLVKRY